MLRRWRSAWVPRGSSRREPKRNVRVLVTRPQPQADAWVARLRARGIDAHALPLIEIAAPAAAQPLEQAWRALARYALVVFVSPSAVDAFFGGRPHDVQWPRALEAAAVGPGTTRALHAVGVARVVEPPHDVAQFDSEALWSQLSARDWRGRNVLIVRGDGGREWLADRLRAAGAVTDAVAAYSRRAPAFDSASASTLAAALAAPHDHVWLFSSSEAIDNLAAAVPGGTDWSRANALATHARIAARARELGVGSVVEARAPFDAVADAIERVISARAKAR
jgi:uroporphyrinogen-III synthase